MLGSFHVVVAPQDFIDAFQDAVAGRADLQGVVTPGLNWKAAAGTAVAAEFTRPTT